MKNDFIRFVIISVLPEPESSYMYELVKEACRITGSRTALTFPPHVTLRTGALVPSDKIKNYIEGFRLKIEQFAMKRILNEKIKITSSSLDFTKYIENGRTKNLVLYYINKTTWLSELNKFLLEYDLYIKSNKKEFIPHVSLCYDDLDDENCLLLKNHIEINKTRFLPEMSFYLDEISLYYQDSDSYWKNYYSQKILI